MDYQEPIDSLTSQQTILYGHHMKAGSQCSSTSDNDDQAATIGRVLIWYVTPTQYEAGACVYLSPRQMTRKSVSLTLALSMSSGLA